MGRPRVRGPRPAEASRASPLCQQLDSSIKSVVTILKLDAAITTGSDVRVEVWTATMRVAVHARALEKGTLTTDFWHYLPVLARKPGAFANAVPVRQASFPPEAAALLEALETAHPGDRRRAHREFLAVCTLGAVVEPVRWRAACATALARGETSAAGVAAALSGTMRPTRSAMVLPARLAEVSVAAGNVAQYGRLLAAER